MDGLLFAGSVSRDKLASYLDAEGFEVEKVKTEEALRKYMLKERPRVVVLTEASKPLLATVREIDKILPVLVIGHAEAKDEDQIAMLNGGADVFISDDSTGEVLAAWLDALFRRMEKCPFGQERYVFGSVEVDVFRRTVKKRGWRILMSATEFDLLVHLIRNNGKVVSREEILKEVWKYDTCPTTRTVDNFICKLRRKIEDTERKPNHLKTVKGTGYRFDLNEESA